MLVLSDFGICRAVLFIALALISACSNDTSRITKFDGVEDQGAQKVERIGTELEVSNPKFSLGELRVTAGGHSYADSGLIVELAGAVEAGQLERSLWVQRAGPTTTIFDESDQTASILIPEVTEPTRLTFAFLAADANGNVAEATKDITALPLKKPFTVSIQYAFGESLGIRLTISVDELIDLPLAVRFATRSGTAIAGEDFDPTGGTIIFSEGNRTQVAELYVPASIGSLPKYLILELTPDRGSVSVQNVIVAIPELAQGNNGSASSG